MRSDRRVAALSGQAEEASVGCPLALQSEDVQTIQTLWKGKAGEGGEHGALLAEPGTARCLADEAALTRQSILQALKTTI